MVLSPTLALRKSTCSPDCARAYRHRFAAEKIALRLRRHGLSDSPTQWVWSDMKRRCYSPHRRGYENYGARGIRVCDRWLHGDGARSGLECFIADLGARPSAGHQLDRIDNDGDYTPENCRWALRSEQDYNKRNTFRFSAFGREWTAAEAERHFGIRRQLIAHRIKVYGMDPERAVTKPARRTAR
jgi:hypothetical protein